MIWEGDPIILRFLERAGYNRGCGPALVPSLWAHVEF